MKKASPAAVAGRRLRRFLGALLVVGFAASWWSFVPPARAAAPPKPKLTTCISKPVSIEPIVKPLAIAIDQIGEAIVPHAGVTPSRVKAPRPKRHVRPTVPMPVTDTPRMPDVTVNVPPTVALPDGTTPPTTDTTPLPELTDEPIYIRTRSS